MRTDKWPGYLPLKETYRHLEQEKSEGGANFEQLHIHIMNLKSWIRGVHDHLSENYFQRYLDEFHFRFNRRRYRKSIFNKLIERMMDSQPCNNNKLSPDSVSSSSIMGSPFNFGAFTFMP